MSAGRLEAALAAIGIRARVEPRDGFALLVTDDVVALAEPRLRHTVVALAGEHGFRSVAAEVRDAEEAEGRHDVIGHQGSDG